MAEKVIRCSEIAKAGYCPYSILAETAETKEVVGGAKAHELQAREIERTVQAKAHRGKYIAAIIIIFLLMLALLWMMVKGVM